MILHNETHGDARTRSEKERDDRDNVKIWFAYARLDFILLLIVLLVVAGCG